ncbi:MAG: flagellar basal body-associated FliL family protein [Pseudomonadota bacterium]
MAEEEASAGEEAKPSLIKRLMLPVILSLVVAGAAVGGLSFFGIISFGPPPADAMAEEGGASEGSEGADGGDDMGDGAAAGSPAFFFSFYPDMLVTLGRGEGSHYLKLKIDVMARDEEVIKGVEQFHPILRNNLIKLFQEVDYATVAGSEGVETLQTIAFDEITRVLKQYHGSNQIEGVYFTSFVVQ